jgi:hypothetical protein
MAVTAQRHPPTCSAGSPVHEQHLVEGPFGQRIGRSTSRFFYQQFQSNKRTEQKRIARLTTNGIEFQSTPRMKIGNCLTELARKRHVIPTRQTGCWSSSCEFIAHTFSIGDRSAAQLRPGIAIIVSIADKPSRWVPKRCGVIDRS